MIANRLRRALLALIFLLVPASQADAFEWLDRMLGIGNTSYYAPTAVAPAYAPTAVAPAYASTAVAPACCRQQTCYSQPTVNYMPQTCYRTVYQLVPVTTYCPTSMCDPCTGCPRTVMRPVTSFVTQASVVPYTSYRPVVTANYAPACGTGCTPTATTVAYPGMGAYSAP